MDAPGEPAAAAGGKCSWAELRRVSDELRRELAAVAGLVPMQVSFGNWSEDCTRVYYLLSALDWGPPLHYVDVPLNARPAEGSGVTRLCGRPGVGALPGPAERPRGPPWGAVSTYQLHPAMPRLLLSVQGSLYTLRQGQMEPQALRSGDGAALAPAMCPARAALVAHAARGDLWLAGAARRPARLTYACRGAPRLEDDPRQAGVPSYVMQEEFSRYTGFWWQPQSNDNVYRILYEEVDESDVKVYSFPSCDTMKGDVEEFRFPRAGTKNARSILRLVEFTLTDKKNNAFESEGSSQGSDSQFDHWDSDSEVVTDCRWLDLIRPLEEVFPWAEYIPRIGWTPCGNYVWCQLLDRRQQRLELVLLSVKVFAEPFRYDTEAPVPHAAPLDSETPRPWIPAQVLVSERAPDAWVNVHDILHFLPAPDPSSVQFIWASEQSGHLHLYLITASVAKREDLAASPSHIEPKIISSLALTKGKWEVIGKNIWVDELRGLVYFVGLKEGPLERHLYCSSYRDPEPDSPALLTEPGYSFTIDMDEKCEVVVATYSNIRTQPACRVYLLRHGPAGPRLVLHGSLLEAGPAPLLPPDCPLYRLPGSLCKGRAQYSQQLLSTRLEGSGEELHAMLFRPHVPGPRPTLLYVYGGPVVQTVTNTFKGTRELRMHMLAARGYCVVCIDSRGSKHRGVSFEAHIRGRMGTVELQDQIEVLKWLAKETGCIDLTRVAVHGWSYGGYLSLMALAQHPDVFKLCVACAPVTAWELYDTAYTERYMGLPALDPLAYDRGSVLLKAGLFPDQENRLLIVHGTQDENVHFLHTKQLIDALTKANKPYQLLLYPDERHSLRQLSSITHYETSLLSFLQSHL